MYFLILAILIGISAWVIRRGLASGERKAVIAGIVLLLATLILFTLMSLWGELLWFEALGFAERFWLFLGARAGALLAGAILSTSITLVLVRSLDDRKIRHAALVAAALGGGWWGAQSWSELLVFIQRLPAGVSDPLYGLDIGFFLFELPFYDNLYRLSITALLVGISASFLELFLRAQDENPQTVLERSDGALKALLTGGALLAVLLAAGQVLNALQLVFSETGVVQGAGWTDVHVRLPGYLLAAAVMLLAGVLPFVQRFRKRIAWHLEPVTSLHAHALSALLAVWAGAAAVWFLALVMLPMLSQWLLVEPNEITYERRYIQRNIDQTLFGFHLEKVEERRFPASERLTRAMVEDNRNLLSEVRLWDWRALDAVYKQFQEIRLYYEFVDVDMDRYTFGGKYRQVMASARELAQQNLAAQSQTFVNRRFKYTHGYGLTLATVSDFTEEGLPNLLVKDIPPRSAYPELNVARPQIYYGELTDDAALVNTNEEEFDYPSGELNRYVHYQGKGGVQLDSLWRKILYGWMFDGTRLLFSGYPNRDSRIMFHRQVRERVQHLAPFLEFDEDPYIVLVDGRLYWIIDAYTTSRYLPYSTPFSSREFVQYREQDRTTRFARRTADDLNGVNYVRNSVKAVVDAYEGSVDLYVFEPGDPIIRVWRRILPSLFRDAAQMPSGLRDHIRYPQDFLLVQGLVYARYHMRDPEVFYNQEDLWVRATEKHYDRVQPVEPYYVMWELPGSDRAEFVLMQPFTPKNRQVLIGWIAGLSDGDNYGRFLAYKFPKEKRVLGPQQVETKIDQDSFLSGQLTLWDQRGSKVIRGNVLAIPLDDTILYVEPVYLQAETAAYPELRLVVVMHGDTMSYAESFDEALAGLFADQPLRRAGGDSVTHSITALGEQLDAAFTAYLNALADRQFDRAAQQLQRLSELINAAREADDRENRDE